MQVEERSTVVVQVEEQPTGAQVEEEPMVMMQVEKRPAMARSNNGQWWCRRRFLRSVPRLAVLFDLKTRPPPHGPPPEPKPVRPAAPKTNIRTRNGGAGRRFLRAAKVEERPTMAKVRSSTANGGAGRSTANGGAG